MSNLNINLIVQAIENNTNFEDELDNLNVDMLTFDEVDYILSIMLDNSYDHDNKYAAITIIDYFDERRISVDPLPALLMLFLNTHLSINLLRWIVSLFPHKEAVGYYYDLINANGMDESTVQIAKLLLNVFPDIIDNEWQQLLELTNNNDEYEYENLLLREFFQAQTNNFSVRPEWILNNSDLKLESEDLTYPDYIPEVDNAVKMIIEDMKKSKIDLEIEDLNDLNELFDPRILGETLLSQYAISTSKEKIMMVSNFMKLDDFDDSEIFRKYGPVNTSCLGKLIVEDHECVKHGGCRMLLCKEYGDFDLTAEETNLPDWFNGKCDQCEKKIKFRHYCVRLPLYSGGWKGCYCSFPCMEKEITNPNVAIMVGRIKTQLLTIGINDR